VKGNTCNSSVTGRKVKEKFKSGHRNEEKVGEKGGPAHIPILSLIWNKSIT